MSDFYVNTRYPDGVQEKPHIQAVPGGRFAITWEDAKLDDGFVSGFFGQKGVYMKLYDTDGTELTGAGNPDDLGFRRVADEARGIQFGGLMTEAGDGFVVAYESERGDLYDDDGSYDVFLQYYDADGEERGDDLGSNNIQVTPRSNEAHRIQDIETLADGSVVVLTARSLVRNDWTLEAWRYDADGDFLGASVVAEDLNTGIIAAFRTVPPGGELTAQPDGGYVATWWEDLQTETKNTPDGLYNVSVLAQGFDADGSARAPASIVSPPAPDRDSNLDNDHRQPTTVSRGDGTNVVYWNSDYSSDPDVVLSRIVDSAGRTIGPVRESVPNVDLFVPLDTLALGDGWTLIAHSEPTSGSYDRIDLRLFNPVGDQVGDAVRGTEFDYISATEASLALADDNTLGLAFQGVDVGLDINANFRPLGDVLAEILGLDAPVLPGDGTLEALYELEPDPDPEPEPEPEPEPDPDRRIKGTKRDDVLTGGTGDDLIIGLGGADVMTGLAGADTFVITGLAGTAPDVTITDWEAGDILAIDDQLLGLGTRKVDIRDLTGATAKELLAEGIASYNKRRAELSIDLDGDGTREVVADLGSDVRLRVDDVLLF